MDPQSLFIGLLLGIVGTLLIGIALSRNFHTTDDGNGIVVDRNGYWRLEGEYTVKVDADGSKTMQTVGQLTNPKERFQKV